MRCLIALLALLATLGCATLAQAANNNPPDIVLAQIYRTGIDPAPYLVSEKYDGVRALWDGQALRHRSGNRVNAPVWFLAALPPEPLDGELWLDRGRFAELSGIVRKAEPVDSEWRQLRYLIFELPGASGSFSERAARIEALVAERNVPWLQAVKQFHVADNAALIKLFKHTTRAGGEGLMLHRADAPYVTGRSEVLLKLKPMEDAEARVVGYMPGRGRYAGMTGALKMEMPDGKRFALGSGLTDELRRNPPPLGSLVSYRYQELSKAGIPRFPRYWRLREEF